jgi:hypothetical protein
MPGKGAMKEEEPHTRRFSDGWRAVTTRYSFQALFLLAVWWISYTWATTRAFEVFKVQVEAAEQANIRAHRVTDEKVDLLTEKVSSLQLLVVQFMAGKQHMPDALTEKKRK